MKPFAAAFAFLLVAIAMVIVDSASTAAPEPATEAPAPAPTPAAAAKQPSGKNPWAALYGHIPMMPMSNEAHDMVCLIAIYNKL